jgi:large subunit ribosomal protein L15
VGLHNLKPARGSVRSAKRVGRGPGSGVGKTSGRGEKGQKSRSGYSRKSGFEGGQMPLHRRLPKRGFRNALFRKHFEVVNLDKLEVFDVGDVVTPELLRERGIVRRRRAGVKILGDGELTKKLTVRAHGFSKKAQEKITALGGKAEIVSAQAAVEGAGSGDEA